jgi:hypothetical protein
MIQVTISDVLLLNKRVGANVYAMEIDGTLVSASCHKSYIKENFLDDLINSEGLLTKRALSIALEILENK